MRRGGLRSRTRIVVGVLAITVAVAALPTLATGAERFYPPDEIGPWAVGYRTTTVIDRSRDNRTLGIDIWYPVDADDADTASPAVLDLLVAEIELDIALDSPPASSAGEFPLVVFSHGSGGISFQSWFLMQALASHGFVVVAPNHVGNTAIDSLTGTPDPFDVVAHNRPRDISYVINRMIWHNVIPSSPFRGVIDIDRVAVVGHSFGGFTALAVAGGFDDYRPDPLVDAIVPIAAAAGFLSDANLSAIKVPTLLLSGTDDQTVPLSNTDRAWDLISTPRGYRADIREAGHNSFTNICDLVDVLLDAGLPPDLLEFLISAAEEGCAPELIDIEEAHRLTNLYTVAFLRRHLLGDKQVDRYLTTRYAAKLSVDFEVIRR